MVAQIFRSWKILLIGMLVGVGAVACASSSGSTQAPESTQTLLEPPSGETFILPETTGQAVWDYLRNVDYQKNWELWPGKGELYQGVEPHGMLLTTYLSPDALAALADKAGSMPDGSIIVKENYTPDGVLDATTVMYKVTRYNPEHNDWFFTKIKADNTVEAEGQVPGCQACHIAKKANDYIFTGDLN